MDNGWLYRVYQIRLFLLIHPFISSFLFLSNFQTLKFFVTHFSRTVRPRRLKLGTLMDRGQMYCVNWNQAAAAYLSLYFLIFLSLQFSSFKSFHHIFSGTVRPRRLKLSTHMNSGWLYRVYQNQAAIAYSSFFHFSFSPINQALKMFGEFSWELWGLEGWNFIQTWTVGGCIVYKEIRLLLLIHPFSSSFFFSPIFKH